MRITPRPYQRTAVQAALKALRGRFKKALVVLATGLGKTYTAAFIAQEFRAKRILFLVHNNFILDHAMSEFSHVFGAKTKMAMFNGMSKNGSPEADIVFATWQTMGKNLKRWRRDHFDLVIVDEAHHTEAETYRPVVEYFTGPKLGITATPDRLDKADIRDIFGSEVANITLEEAIARGWLPRIEYHVITDESLDEDALQQIAREIREARRRFTMAEVNRRIFIRKRDKEIARIINGYTEKAIVFCASIKHAERMNKSLVLSSVFHSEAGSGQKEVWHNNQVALEGLKNGTIRRICSVNAFNEGVNVPSVGLVAFCRVTSAQTIFRQQLGRGLRPGKDKLIVLDFVGNLERIQQVQAMMNTTADMHEQFTPQQDREREGYERQRFEVSGAGFEFTFSDRIVDLMKILEHVESDFYPTCQEAGNAAVAMGIKIAREYKLRYKEDPRLHSNPKVLYGDFPSWPEFLGRPKVAPYGSWQEASKAAIHLEATSAKEYFAAIARDPRLPSNPYVYYEDFPGFPVFLGKSVIDHYGTWEEASTATRQLGINTQTEYSVYHKKDPRLPSSPLSKYQDFPGWDAFFGREKKRLYSTWLDASQSAISLGFKSKSEYSLGYKRDPRLPASPGEAYEDFPGWKKFLGKEK